MIGLFSRNSSNECTLDDIDAETKAQFNVFEDYLGLINLVCPPPRSSSSCEALMSSMFDFPRGERTDRQRINSLDSDSLSDSSSSSGGRDFDLIYDTMSCNSTDFPSYPSIPSPPLSMNNEPVPYNPSLEAFLACQKNVLSRLQPGVMLKENRNSKTANKATVCVFCRNNGESREFYSSHTLKDVDGKTSCPILRAYTCPLCKANGDNSHTIKYCPKYTPKVKAEKLLAVGLTL